VKASSKQNPNIYKEIPVTITDEVTADEHFYIIDEANNILFTAGDEASLITLDTGESKQLFARVTGGDGDTDLAGIDWVSNHPDVLQAMQHADDQRGIELRALSAGEAKITLTLTLYGNPLYTKTAELNFSVVGEEKLLPRLQEVLEQAISAKTFPDDY